MEVIMLGESPCMCTCVYISVCMKVWVVYYDHHVIIVILVSYDTPFRDTRRGRKGDDFNNNIYDYLCSYMNIIYNARCTIIFIFTLSEPN